MIAPTVKYLFADKNHVHINVAEAALGKKLPKGSVVHHVNENKHDNRNENLVICNSRAYHNLIHRRIRAYEATGDADSVKCVYCKEWGTSSSMYVRERSRGGHEARHRSCHAKASAKYKSEQVA